MTAVNTDPLAALTKAREMLIDTQAAARALIAAIDQPAGPLSPHVVKLANMMTSIDLFFTGHRIGAGHSTSQRPVASDAINHPPHYVGGRRFEPIDVIEDWHLGFCLGSALKYIARAGRKEGEPPAQDLRKAAWYVTREAERLERP